MRKDFFFLFLLFPSYLLSSNISPTEYRATRIVDGIEELEHPTDISIDKFGAIYVTDTGNGRVKKFSERGEYLKSFGAFSFPTGIACVDGWVYVVDRGKNAINKFTLSGEFFPIEPPKEKFKHLNDLCISKEGDIYVVEGDRSCATDGEYLYVTNLDRIQKYKIPEMRLVLEFGEWGVEDGEVRAPQGIAVDGLGAIYVSDTLNNRIQKFSPDGAFLTSFGGFGSGVGELFHPMGIAVNEKGEVWVVEEGNHRIQKFSPLPAVPKALIPSRDYAWLYSHARRLQTLGRHREAVALYTRCINLAPEDDPLLSRCEFYRGECWRALQDFEFALLAYERVVRKYPHSREAPRALLIMGDLSYQAGLMDEAEECYRFLIDNYSGTIHAKRAKLRLSGLR